jgi:hypothetical protein
LGEANDVPGAKFCFSIPCSQESAGNAASPRGVLESARIDTFVQLTLPEFFGLIVSVETESSNLGRDYAPWSKPAERELGAFLAAVTEIFGAEWVRQAAEDWLDNLDLLEILPVNLNWRPITVAAAIRLAQRLNGNADRS